jgi:hypothetical protein
MLAVAAAVQTLLLLLRAVPVAAVRVDVLAQHLE